MLRTAVPTGIEPARSNLGVTELLEQIWAEKAIFLSVLHFTSSFVTFQVFFKLWVWTKVSGNRSKKGKRKKETADEKGQSRRGMEKTE